MSWEYAEAKIREALDAHKGNATRARQQVIAWAQDDPKLLNALVRPHMTGITAHAINRVMSGKKAPETVRSAPKTPAKPGQKETFGMDILKTIAGGDTAQFGQESYSRPLSRKGVSQRHIDAIQEMINKSRNK